MNTFESTPGEGIVYASTGYMSYLSWIYHEWCETFCDNYHNGVDDSDDDKDDNKRRWWWEWRYKSYLSWNSVRESWNDWIDLPEQYLANNYIICDDSWW